MTSPNTGDYEIGGVSAVLRIYRQMGSISAPSEDINKLLLIAGKKEGKQNVKK